MLEITAAGIYNSQFIAKSIPVSNYRTAKKFEIELPLDHGGISYIDSNSAAITPELLICAKPGQVRHTKFPYKCFFVHVTLHDSLLYDTLLRTPDYLYTAKSHTYREIFTRLVDHFNSAEKSEILLQSLVLELIYTIGRDTAGQQKRRERKTGTSAAVDTAIQYIKENLTEDLSLNTVAAAVSLSPIHFHNLFKSAVGKTLREYVEEQRIRKAIHLLVTTDDSLTQIAFACGFSSQSYFSYVFKRRIGQTPREYVQEVYKKYEI